MEKKPYPLDVCDKSFDQNGYFSIYRRTHSGEKPYICTSQVVSREWFLTAVRASITRQMAILIERLVADIVVV